MDNEAFKLYEQDALRIVTGDTIRPGGIHLTEHAFNLFSLPERSWIVDVACGTGASVQWLREKNGFRVMGVDVSPRMLQAGRQRCSDLPLVCGNSLSLPIASGQVEAILAECSLSLMNDLDGILKEFYRVLRPSGHLIVSDLYLRNPQAADLFQNLPMDFCLKGAKSQSELFNIFKTQGFEILFWEDHTENLKQLTGQLIMTHGSIQGFWCKSLPDDIDTFELQTAVARAKPGYYLLVARKV